MSAKIVFGLLSVMCSLAPSLGIDQSSDPACLHDESDDLSSFVQQHALKEEHRNSGSSNAPLEQGSQQATSKDAGTPEQDSYFLNRATKSHWVSTTSSCARTCKANYGTTCDLDVMCQVSGSARVRQVEQLISAGAQRDFPFKLGGTNPSTRDYPRARTNIAKSYEHWLPAVGVKDGEATVYYPGTTDVCRATCDASPSNVESNVQDVLGISHRLCACICDESLKGSSDSEYRGCQTQTRSGRTCQEWQTIDGSRYWSTPHYHPHQRTSDNYPNKGLGWHNYCRNPDGHETIWCYTTDPKAQWEYCDPVMDG